jgi:hypothetical protein
MRQDSVLFPTTIPIMILAGSFSKGKILVSYWHHESRPFFEGLKFPVD